MSTPKIICGKTGEEKARSYLLKQGYRILETNYHSRFGEIDIISMQGEELVFIEVKTRASSLQTALQSVSHSKQKKLAKTAAYYLSQNPHLQDNFTRFDVIAVLTKKSQVFHLKNAFTP